MGETSNPEGLVNNLIIGFHCSNHDCRRKLKAAADMAGRKVRCPKCNTVITVPTATTDSAANAPSGYEATMARPTDDVVQTPNDSQFDSQMLGDYQLARKLGEARDEVPSL